MLRIVFECNGSDVMSLPCENIRTEGDLMHVAQLLAARNEVDLNEITLRFAAGKGRGARTTAPRTPPVTNR